MNLASCPKCNSEIGAEYKYCPNCGFQLSSSLDVILLSKYFGEVEPRKGVHNLAQARLCEMGKEFGFYSIKEYGIPDLTKEGRRSYIDVIWKSRNGIEYAFEVRRKIHDLNIITTLKDTNKLQNVIARKKFIVNVSELTGRAYFNEVTGEPKLNEIEEPIQKEKLSYSSDSRRQNYPRMGFEWTKQEDADLIEYFQKGLTISELAGKHQRKRGGIRARLIRLGLIERDEDMH